jgi:hypothetical protein
MPESASRAAEHRPVVVQPQSVGPEHRPGASNATKTAHVRRWLRRACLGSPVADADSRGDMMARAGSRRAAGGGAIGVGSEGRPLCAPPLRRCCRPFRRRLSRSTNPEQVELGARATLRSWTSRSAATRDATARGSATSARPARTTASRRAARIDAGRPTRLGASGSRTRPSGRHSHRAHRSPGRCQPLLSRGGGARFAALADAHPAAATSGRAILVRCRAR